MATDPLAQAVMVAYCGWDPTEAVTETTVQLDGNGTRLLTLPSLYVTGVAAVTITDRWGTVHALTVGPGDTDVGWSQNGCLTYKGCEFGGAWPIDQQNVTVTYSGGYESTPDDLDAALAKLSSRLSTVGGATSKRLGSAAFSYSPIVAAGGLLTVEQMVFDRYRLPRAA